MPTNLNTEAAVRAMAEAFNFDLTPYEEEAPESDPSEDTGQHGASHIPEAQAYFDSLTHAQRATLPADLPQSDGPLYAITDDSRHRLENSGDVNLARVHLENQNHLWAAMQDPGQFIMAANYYPDQPGVPQEAWTRVIVFRPGVRDADVLGFLKARIAANSGNTAAGTRFGR